MSEITTWQELRDAVGQWSAANFGTQAGLGALAPLMGMCEEVGELDEAMTIYDREDAKGDILIFLMDYCYRAGVDLSHVPTELDPCILSPTMAVGRLHHVQLKRLQRIRGMEDYDVFLAAQRTSVQGLLRSFVIRGLVDQPNHQPFYIAKTVWANVVSKRQWKDYTGQATTRDQCLHDFSAVLRELHQGL